MIVFKVYVLYSDQLVLFWVLKKRNANMIYVQLHKLNWHVKQKMISIFWLCYYVVNMENRWVFYIWYKKDFCFLLSTWWITWTIRNRYLAALFVLSLLWTLAPISIISIHCVCCKPRTIFHLAFKIIIPFSLIHL